MKIRIIGDVHGKYSRYLDLIKDQEYSIQLGDMRFDYSTIANRNVENHLFLLGNHEQKRSLIDDKGCLKYFGTHNLAEFEFFYLSGSFSIDWQMRTIGYFRGGTQTWNEDEELDCFTLREAIRMYIKTKPNFVLTHDCPLSVARIIGTPGVLKSFGYLHESFMTRTQLALEFMFSQHRPKMWFFGHFHTAWDRVVEGTNFICLPELSYYDLTV